MIEHVEVVNRLRSTNPSYAAYLRWLITNTLPVGHTAIWHRLVYDDPTVTPVDYTAAGLPTISPRSSPAGLASLPGCAIGHGPAPIPIFLSATKSRAGSITRRTTSQLHEQVNLASRTIGDGPEHPEAGCARCSSQRPSRSDSTNRGEACLRRSGSVPGIASWAERAHLDEAHLPATCVPGPRSVDAVLIAHHRCVLRAARKSRSNGRPYIKGYHVEVRSGVSASSERFCWRFRSWIRTIRRPLSRH